MDWGSGILVFMDDNQIKLTTSQSKHLFFILSTYSNLTHHPKYQHLPKLSPTLLLLRENLPFPYTNFTLSLSHSNLTLLHSIFNDYITQNHNYHGVPFFSSKSQLSTHQTIFRKLSKLL